jgi:hypothetical protein
VRRVAWSFIRAGRKSSVARMTIGGGYTFRARRSKNRWGKLFVNFSPKVGNAATKAIREEVRNW